MISENNVPRDLDRNKAVFVQGRYVFAYSGPATTNGENTDQWLARICARRPDENVRPTWLGQLQRYLADETPVDKPFAICGFGWVTGDDGSIDALHIVMTNAMDVDTGKWEKVDKKRILFQWRKHLKSRHVLFSVPTGGTLNRITYRATQRLIVKAAKAGGPPDVIASYLAAEIRRSSISSPGSIGSDVLVMVVPRPAGSEFRELLVPTYRMQPKFDAPICYVTTKEGVLKNWSGPVFVYDGWAIGMSKEERTASDYSLSTTTLAAGVGYAGCFMDTEAGVRLCAVARAGVPKPIGYERRDTPRRNMMGLNCPDIFHIELEPKPEITSLVDRADYAIQYECQCPYLRAYRPRDIVKIPHHGWGVSMKWLARRYECPHCRTKGAKRAFASVLPDTAVFKWPDEA